MFCETALSACAAVGYAQESIHLARPLADLTVSLGRDAASRDFLRGTRRYENAALGILAAAYYDMAHSEERADPTARSEAVNRSALTNLAGDIIDDVIDERPGPFTPKFAYMDKVCAVMCGEDSVQTLDSDRSDPEKAAAIDLALDVRKRLPEAWQKNALRDVLMPVIDAVKRQPYETNAGNLLVVAQQIGGGCFDLAQVHVDIIDGTERLGLRQAGRYLGAYAEVVDHLYEVDHDLNTGMNTYPTLRINNEGDTPTTRRSVREECLETANGLYKKGAELLTPQQLVSYRALRFLCDTKYAVTRFQSMADKFRVSASRIFSPPQTVR